MTRRFTSPRILATLAVAALIAHPTQAQSTSTFFEFRLPDATAPEGFQPGDFGKTFGTASMDIAPSGNGINLEIDTQLLPGAYSVWAAVFNKPEECPDGCNGRDLIVPEVEGSLMWVYGGVVDANPLDPNPGNPTMLNSFTFSKLLELNSPPGEVRVAGAVDYPPSGLEPKGLTSLGAEIHPVIRYHGPASSDPVERMAQTNTYAGGCEIISGGTVVQAGPFLCHDPQAAILSPIPEPSSALLAVTGIGGLGFIRRRRAKP